VGTGETMGGTRLCTLLILFWKKCRNDSQKSAELLMTVAEGLVSLLTTENRVLCKEDY